MINEPEWLELLDLPVFEDRDDPRFGYAWKWTQELQQGGRMSRADIFALQCLIDSLTRASLPAATKQERIVHHEPGCEFASCPIHICKCAHTPAPSDQEKLEGWQLIETAPKDGTTIDVWRDGRRETVYWGFRPHECGEMGQHCDSEWHSEKEPGWVCSTFGEFVGGKYDAFTHWMPIPAGPITRARQIGEG